MLLQSRYKNGILHFLQIYNIHKGSKCYKPFTTFELHTSCESKKNTLTHYRHRQYCKVSQERMYTHVYDMYLRYIKDSYKGVPLLYAEFNWQ